MTKKELEERIEELEEQIEELSEELDDAYAEREAIGVSKEIKTAVSTTMAMINTFEEKGLSTDQAINVVIAIITSGMGR